MTDQDWIAVDWGTSNLRVWRMQGSNAVAEASSDQGMGAVAPGRFEAALLALIEGWLEDRPMTVVACGMVGSRQGWHEAPYRAVPCVSGGAMVRVPQTDERIAMHILSGVSQAKPADVMRGEETQIAGLIALEPDFDGVACLPGTHTKWAKISAGELCHFRTAMTGEMFHLLSTGSVLRHSMGEGWDADAFMDAIGETLSRPERLATALFNLRADGLLHGASGDVARARLSGLLLGAELAALKPYWLGERVDLIGTPGLNAAYMAALSQVGIEAKAHDGTELVLAGLTAAWKAMT